MAVEYVNLPERVERLEKKNNILEEEIIDLKSTLSNIHNRITSHKTKSNDLVVDKNSLALNPKHTIKLIKESPATFSKATSSYSKPIPERKSRIHNCLQIDIPDYFSHIVKKDVWNSEDGSLRLVLRDKAVTLYAPSYMKDYDESFVPAAPKEQLSLEWIYGYRGQNCKSFIQCLPTGELVYFVANVVILYSCEDRVQRHYTGHTDAINCLTLHPDKVHIASGQVSGPGKIGTKAHIRVWHSVTLTTIYVIGVGDFLRAVACLSFSKHDGGYQLAAIDDSSGHTLYIWDISNANCPLLAQTKTSAEMVVSLEYHPHETDVLVTCGKGHIAFWMLEYGELSKKLGTFKKCNRPKIVSSLMFTESGEIVSGDTGGNILSWNRTGNQINQANVNVHPGGVSSLLPIGNDRYLSGGSTDVNILEWNGVLDKIRVFGLIPDQYGGVRNLSFDHQTNQLFIGCTKNCLLQQINEFYQVVSCGHSDEVWGVAMHPKGHQFLTCGYDKCLYLWDILQHTIVWGLELTDRAQCCCFHPHDNMAAIGLHNGRWLVLNLPSKDVIFSSVEDHHRINVISFSPDGSRLAVGSDNGIIYVYSISETIHLFTKIGHCIGHTYSVTHMDWSIDSKHIRSNSVNLEILFWLADSCKMETQPEDVRDMQWFTDSCVLTFSSAGLWQSVAKCSDITATSRANSVSLSACGTDNGSINLFQFPNCHLKAECNSVSGYLNHISNLTFSPDDTQLVTTSARCCAVFQWTVVTS